MDLNIGGGAYSIDAPISLQECINMYPQVSEKQSKAQVTLMRFPGLTLFSTPTGVARGAITMNGIAYFVMGTTLYEVQSNGANISRGTIAGTGRVSMAENGTYIAIVNGTSTGYTYTGTTLTTITDTDFLAADQVIYLDTYFIFKRVATNQYFISDNDDPTSYTAPYVGVKEGSSGLLTAIIANHRDLIIAGETTTEYHRNTGNTDFVFERQEGTFQERGCAATFSIAAMDNSYYYLGDDRMVYTAVGYRPGRISHHAIEKWLSEQSLADITAAIGFTMTWQGHYWYVLTLTNGTWVYDATTSQLTESAEWFQLRSSTGETGNWRVTTTTIAYGKILCGDAAGKIYTLDADALTENGETVLRRRTTRPYFLERKRIGCPKLELVTKVGKGNATVENPVVSLKISKDNGVTYHTPRQKSLGKMGEYDAKTIWRKNGRAYDWVFQWNVTDAVDVSFVAAYADFTWQE